MESAADFSMSLEVCQGKTPGKGQQRLTFGAMGFQDTTFEARNATQAPSKIGEWNKEEGAK